MKEYALITGASSGIGLAMARELASRRYNLILVARSAEKLEAIKKELELAFVVDVVIIAADLSSPDIARMLVGRILHEQLQVNLLINNAGVGLYGDFINTSLESELNMINLNVSSLVVLTKLFAAEMRQRGSGRIMNVASLLSFLPFPYYAVYSATKAFVLAFTETIAAELEGTGVVVTALCPGPVDTAFNSQEMWSTNAYKANKPVSPESVARAGVDLLLHGKGKKIVGFNNWFISNLPRVTPDFLMMKIKKQLASQQR